MSFKYNISQIVNTKNYFYYWLLILLSVNCTLHHLEINDSPAIQYKTKRLSEKRKFELERIHLKRQDISKERQLHESYNSESLNQIIERGCCILIENNKNLDYSIKYSTELVHKIPFGITPIFFLLTLGISPVYETIDSSVSFQIVEKKTGRTLKEYNYQGDHKLITSWFSLFAAFFLWGDQWKLALFSNHQFPLERITSRFENDFASDIELQKILLKYSPKSIQNKNYAILPVTYSHSKDKETSFVLRDKIETVLVNKKYNVLERSKLNEVLKEFKLSQLGITRNNQIELGQMLNADNLILIEILELNQTDGHLEFSIKNLEIESGRIVWKYEFQLDETKISKSINQVMQSLDKKI